MATESTQNPPDDPSKKKILTKEMIEQLKAQLDAMEGKEIKEGGPVTHGPGEHEIGWYIAYST
jgi:hypothetical protein